MSDVVINMSKYILGIHNGVEASVCLLREGALLEAISEERLNGQKVYAGKPELALQYLFRKYDFTPAEVEAVVYSRVTYQNDWSSYTKKLASRAMRAIVKSPECEQVFLNRIQTEFDDEVYRREFVDWMTELGIDGDKIVYLDHHVAHAWSAFSCSPFSRALVITADGRGDLKSTTISTADTQDGLTEHDYLLSFDSLGFLYGQITTLLGFTAHRHEGKVTGLAAFGDSDKTLPIFDEMITWDESVGSWVSNFGLYAPHNRNGSEVFKKAFAPFRREDIAAGVQRHVEELICRYVTYWIKKLGKDAPRNICMAGGVFANVKINQRIAEIEGIDDVFIFPNMGDGGLVVGGVCYQNFRSHGEAHVNLPTVYLGTECNDDEIVNELSLHSDRIVFRRLTNRPEEIADLLDDGVVVGYFDGRMEFGPRALGARSILANARDKSINDELNNRLERTEFMPFAPVTPVDFAAECYEEWKPQQICARFMTRTYDCHRDFIRQHPAVVHIDGTARPQIICREHNPRYYDVVMSYCRKTGEKALINTSFNAHEEPIIRTPDKAIRNLLEDRIDALVLGDYLVSVKK
jgi:carbamoyltransferase